MKENYNNAIQKEKVNNSLEKPPLYKITGLWQSKDQNGDLVYTVKIHPFLKILIMKNDYKKKTSEPDYNLYLNFLPPASPRAAVTQDDPDTSEFDPSDIDLNIICPDDIRL